MIRTVVPSSVCVTPWKVQKENLHLHNPVGKRKSDLFIYFKAGASARRKKEKGQKR